LLEARQISGDNNYEQSPLIIRKKRVKKAGMMQAKIVVVGCVLFAVVTGLMLTATHSQVTHKTDKIIQIKSEISDLQNANERLKLKIARLKSLDRIELIAKTELGMIQPQINNVEYMAFDNGEQGLTTAEALEGENKAAVEVPSDQMVHRAILAVNKMVSDYVFDIQGSSPDI